MATNKTARRPTSKRKYGDNIALLEFSVNWEEQYFFALGKSSKPVRLLCNATVAVCKKFNIEYVTSTSYSGTLKKNTRQD
jgi:hypothetical protein